MGITTRPRAELPDVTLPIGQMYHVAIDNQVPYWVYSNRQDDGTMRGPSNSPVPVTNVPTPTYTTARPAAGGGAAAGGGEGEGGGGGGGGGGAGARGRRTSAAASRASRCPTRPTPTSSGRRCYGNKVTRFDNRLGTGAVGEPVDHTLDSEPNKVKYRCHWTPPLAIDPFDHKTVYYGCQVIFKTSQRGQSWTVISPDLSTNDPTRIVSSGGIVGDNLGQFYGEVVFAIAPSKIQQRPDLGRHQRRPDLDTRATAAATGPTSRRTSTGLPAWGTVRQIEPSRFDAGTAYVAVDFHMMDNREPFIYKTTDFGQTWKRISGDTPAGHPLDYVMSVAENPNRKGMLFAGTGHGFYYSIDDGAHWTQFKDGLPAAPVTWIEVAPRVARRRGLDLRPRPVDPARHHARSSRRTRCRADAPLFALCAAAGRSGRRAADGPSSCTPLKAAPATGHASRSSTAPARSIRTLERARRAPG